MGVEAEDEDKTPEVRGNMADTLRVCEMVGGVAVCVLQVWVWRRKGRGWGISRGVITYTLSLSTHVDISFRRG